MDECLKTAHCAIKLNVMEKIKLPKLLISKHVICLKDGDNGEQSSNYILSTTCQVNQSRTVKSLCYLISHIGRKYRHTFNFSNENKDNALDAIISQLKTVDNSHFFICNQEQGEIYNI